MSEPIQRFQTNARMSKVVIANGVVYLSGQIPATPFALIDEQTKEVVGRIDALLESVGINKTRLLTANIWLSDPKHFDAFNVVWDAWVPEGQAPVRACVTAQLMTAGLDVEIAVTALA